MKAAYWIISAAITLAGICIMGVGAAERNKEYKQQASSAVPGEGTAIHETFSDIHNLNLDVGSMAVKLLPDPDAEVITVDIVDAPDNLVLRNDDGMLVLEQQSSGFSFFDFSDSNLYTKTTITVPEGMHFSDVSMKIGSGDVSEMRGIRADSLFVDVGSGNAYLQEVKVYDDCYVTLGSGNMTLENSELMGGTVLDNGSGDFSLKGCAFGSNLMTGTGSGDMKIDHITVGADMTATFGSGSLTGEGLTVEGSSLWSFGSGDADVKALQPGSLMEIDLGSGDIKMTLTGSLQDYLFNSVDFSGDVTIGGQKMKEVESFGSGSREIRIHGGSGTVKADFME